MNDPIRGRLMFAPEGADGKAGHADAGGNSGAGDGKPEPKAGDETITKAEAERVLKARLERERAKYADYDSVKSRLAELEAALETREQADLEAKGKYDEALANTTKRHQSELEKLVRDRDDWSAKYKTLAIDNAVLAEAQKSGALDPQDVLALVRGRVVLGADGVPSFDDGKSIADGVKAFLDSKPHLVRAASRGGSGTNHRGGSGASVPDKPFGQMSPEEIHAMGGREILARIKRSEGLPWQIDKAQKG